MAWTLVTACLGKFSFDAGGVAAGRSQKFLSECRGGRTSRRFGRRRPALVGAGGGGGCVRVDVKGCAGFTQNPQTRLSTRQVFRAECHSAVAHPNR